MSLLYNLIKESANNGHKRITLKHLYAILRYTTQEYQLLDHENATTVSIPQDLLRFIEAHQQEVVGKNQSLVMPFFTHGQSFEVLFIPEESSKTDLPQTLVIVQIHEPLDLESPDISTFAEDLKLFFRKGAHDLKNLFSSTKLLLQKNMVEKAQMHLADLENYYLKQIEGFYEAFEAFINTRKPKTPQTRGVSFESLVMGMMKEYGTLLENNMTVETNFEACPQITYREDFLQSMIKSLFDNAIRYRAEDRPAVIRMYTERKGEKVFFTIQDNGIGIDMDRYGSKLCMPFQRFTRQSNGQGISLHLVKVMVEKSGGSIQINSTLHQGTEVKLTLIPFHI